MTWAKTLCLSNCNPLPVCNLSLIPMVALHLCSAALFPAVLPKCSCHLLRSLCPIHVDSRGTLCLVLSRPAV